MNKVRASALEALQGIQDGASIAAGGFGLCGIPELCIRALRDFGVRDLTIASNNCGVDDFGLGLLLSNRQIRKMIVSGRSNAVFPIEVMREKLPPIG